MNSDDFAHDGQSGHWIYTIYRVQAEDGMFSAAADIQLRGQNRCKLVLTITAAERAVGIERLKQRCIAWIEDADARARSENRHGTR